MPPVNFFTKFRQLVLLHCGYHKDRHAEKLDAENIWKFYLISDWYRVNGIRILSVHFKMWLSINLHSIYIAEVPLRTTKSSHLKWTVKRPHFKNIYAEYQSKNYQHKTAFNVICIQKSEQHSEKKVEHFTFQNPCQRGHRSFFW